jgi:ArsR family transcriptional regulator, arsenate/arsenite/antimonite-responsive transcriptional repressor
MKSLERIFKGLADQNRLRILGLLLHGELCVCDIQFVLEAPQPNVSRHLTYLKNSGLATDRREGPRIYYRLADPSGGINGPLFSFLREAFRGLEIIAQDSRKLEDAIKNGSCTAGEWRPYSGLKTSTKA